jgi:hypothetical protein
MEVEHGFH